jgi:hypothetical protein
MARIIANLVACDFAVAQFQVSSFTRQRAFERCSGTPIAFCGQAGLSSRLSGETRMSKKLIATLVAAAFSCGAAIAQSPSNANGGVANTVENPATPPGTVMSQEAKDAKVHSKAEYKARKKIAEANKDLNKADCETSANGSVERACKKEAKAAAKHEKAEAKTTYETEKKQIKDGTKP